MQNKIRIDHGAYGDDERSGGQWRIEILGQSAYGMMKDQGGKWGCFMTSVVPSLFPHNLMQSER